MESKKIEDYLHLYLGAEIYYPETKEKSVVSWTHLLDLWDSENKGEEWNPSFVLVLRNLSDMTEEEKKEYKNFGHATGTRHGDIELQAKRTAYLLSNHFDLFSLIPSGLAIDKNTLK